jgi:3-hydroxyisobutyrate dehydrogenase
MSIGFIGLGVMGQPMATNLARAGTPLLVWSRSRGAVEPLRALGAQIAETPAEVFRRAPTVIVMLVDERAIDVVLGRGTPGFAAMLAHRLVVNMGSVSPGYAMALAADVRAAGGRYVEAPVSGSRKPAETGQLVAMLGGAADDVEEVRAIVAPMCHASFACGAVPGATLMKLSVNVFMLTMLSGLAEAFQFADGQGLDRQQLLSVIEAGPLASSAARVKGAKLVGDDFSAQALATDALRSTELITHAARAASLPTPILDQVQALYRETVALGHGGEDMIAIVKAFAARKQHPCL